jgi:beta-glucanase (GH16 family)
MHWNYRTVVTTVALTASIGIITACGTGSGTSDTADVHSYLDFQQDTNLTYDTLDIAAIPFTPGETRCIPFEQHSDADVQISPVTPFSTIAVTDEQNNTLVSMGQYETPQTLSLDAGQKYHICATLDKTMPAEVYYMRFAKTSDTLELTDDCPGCNLQRIELNEIPDANLSETDLRHAQFNGVALENYDMVGAKTDWSYNDTKWKLARDEEFNGNDIAPDPDKWQYAYGNFPQYAWQTSSGATGNQAWGWGGPDMEFYTDNPSNVRIKNGNLVITATKLPVAGQIPSETRGGYFQCNADGGGIVRNDATNTPSTTSTPVTCQCASTVNSSGGYNNAPCQYASARVNSQNGSFKGKYGKIEARIKYPKGAGTWPAYWMMGANHDWNVGIDNKTDPSLWPNNGEIDIAEYLGVNPTQMPQLLHSSGNVWSNDPGWHIAGNDHYDAGVDLSQDYHTYGLIWEPNKFVWYIDGKQTTCVSKEKDVTNTDGGTTIKCVPINPPSTVNMNNSWPFDQDFYFILNFAISQVYDRGNPANTTFPLSMKIDYIRWYVPQ